MTQLLNVFKRTPRQETPPLLRIFSTENTSFGRPVFRAPPLSVKLPKPTSEDFHSASARPLSERPVY